MLGQGSFRYHQISTRNRFAGLAIHPTAKSMDPLRLCFSGTITFRQVSASRGHVVALVNSEQIEKMGLAPSTLPSFDHPSIFWLRVQAAQNALQLHRLGVSQRSDKKARPCFRCEDLASSNLSTLVSLPCRSECNNPLLIIYYGGLWSKGFR